MLNIISQKTDANQTRKPLEWQQKQAHRTDGNLDNAKCGCDAERLECSRVVGVSAKRSGRSRSVWQFCMELGTYPTTSLSTSGVMKAYVHMGA